MSEGPPEPSPAESGGTEGGGPRHLGPRSRLLSKPVLIVAAVAVIAAAAGGTVALVSSSSSGPTLAQREAAAAAAAAKSAAEARAQARLDAQQLAAQMSITPAPGATGVALDSVVKVLATGATVQSVTLTSGGAAVPGTFDAATGQWTPAAGLAPTATYTITAEVAVNGQTAMHTSTFTTLTPVETAEATVYPSEGTTVGVGEPIVVTFDYPITSAVARAAIESRLTVAMGRPQVGGWYWFSDEVLHFRPEIFWKADQPIQVSGNLDGIDLGDGVWTAGTVLDSFTIGDARISYANLAAEVMTVTRNGATVYSIPISGGRPEYPTMNGVHIVLDKEPVVHMVSSTVGIPVNSPNGYDEYVYDDVHISMSGEYVHAAPWSVYAQGVDNVSHGCINVSPANALSFYNFSEVGDVVEVTGSARPALTTDGGVRDWSGPAWSEWSLAKVLKLASSGAAATPETPVTAPPITAPPTTEQLTTTTTVRATTTTTVKSTTTTTHPTSTTSTTKPPKSTTTTTVHH